MDYVTVRELSEESGDIWRRVEAGQEFVVTRDGKPIALLVPTQPDQVQDIVRALHLARLGQAVQHIQTQAMASGAAQLSDADIQAEIDAVRLKLHST